MGYTLLEWAYWSLQQVLIKNLGKCSYLQKSLVNCRIRLWENVLKVFEIKGNNSFSKIIIGERFDKLADYTNGKKLFIITDKNVVKIYGERFPEADVFAVGVGEMIKNYKTVNDIYSELIAKGHDRKSFIIGIGGGIVCDIAGFIASTYMRGVDFGFVPTTLLAQVDASIGGKNGINFDNYKNMIGTFNQPSFVLTDFSFLKTLSEEEYANGLAETIKHALIGSKVLLEMLIKKKSEILNRELSDIEDMIIKSVGVKVDIVKRDETEKGERKKLNFGHSLGHAIELTDNISHGKAVSIGMAYASEISYLLGEIDKGDYNKIVKLLNSFGLPVKTLASMDKLTEKLRMDKKKNKEKIDFVLLKSLGKAFVESMRFTDLEAIINDMS